MTLPSQLFTSRTDFENFCRKNAFGVPYGDHRILCRVFGTRLAFVDDRDLSIGPHLIADGYWESWVTLAIARYLWPGMYCVDVGANYGYYSILMGLVCGSQGRVAAFEPLPWLYEKYLVHNLNLNGLDNVEAHSLAIGEKVSDSAPFYVRDLGGSSLLSHVSRVDKEITVAKTTIDQAVSEWPRLDLVKIDAEGAETLIWHGMQETIRRFPHVVLVLELHYCQYPQQVANLLREIVEAGFPLRVISFDGEIATINAATIYAHPKRTWTLWLSRD